MTLVANVLTSQFSDWIEQLERIVLIGSCVFLFLGYVAESKNSWAPGRKSIGSLQMICRVWGGGGRWRTLGVDHKIFRGNKRGISRRQ